MTAQLSDRAPQPTAGPTKRRGQSPVKRFIPILLVILGIAVLLYPVVGTYLQNRNQSVVSQVYTDTIASELSDEENDRMIAEAKRYNREEAAAPILDPWLARVREDNPAYLAYLDQLSVMDQMGRIVIPSIKSDLPIYHGTTEEILQKGVGHLFGSSLPVGGDSSHAVLTGHTGLSHATLWDNLRDVKTGDAIYIQVGKEKIKYEVHGTEVILPSEVEGLVVKPGEDLLTLITCTPYGINSHRLLVNAHRVPMEPEEANIFSEPITPWQWWMTAVLVAVAAIIALCIFNYLRRKRKAQDSSGNEVVKG